MPRRALCALAVLVMAAGCSDTSSRSATPTSDAPATTISPLVADLVDTRGNTEEGGYPEVDVRVVDSEFIGGSIRIDPGVTVAWTNAGRLDHNIVAVESDQPLGVETSDFAPGQTYEQRFTDPGVYVYFCSLHGTADGGMRGMIVVGGVDPAVPGPHAPPPGPPKTLTVPDDQPSIQEAVDNAPEGSLVLVRPGVYSETVIVTTDRLVIRGLDRDRTVLDGGQERQNGFLVFADGVAIENMTARDYMASGFVWNGVTGFRGSYLTAVDNRLYGIYAFDSRSGIIEHSYAAGGSDSGFYVGKCDPCDTLITDVVAENNDLGFSGANASSGLSIVESAFRRNRAGIVLATLDFKGLAPQHDALVAGNTLEDNGVPDAPRKDDGFLDVDYGMGIAVIGALDDVVLRNHVTGSARVGIAVTPNPAFEEKFWPVERTRVEGNTVTGSGMFDIGFVPLPDAGANCFSGNTYGSTAPFDLEAAAPCDAIGTGAFNAGAIDVGAYLELEAPPAPPSHPSIVPVQPEMPDAASAPGSPADHLETTVDPASIGA